MIKVYIFNIDKTINLIYYSYNQEYIFTIYLFKQITCEINKLLNKKISQDSKMLNYVLNYFNIHTYTLIMYIF